MQHNMSVCSHCKEFIIATIPARLSKVFVLYLFLLTGLAVGGKGFAYLGFHPLYISEAILMIMIATALPLLNTRAFNMTPVLILLVFMTWSFFCTARWLPVYGIDAVRDGMLWIYGLIALAIIAHGYRTKIVYITISKLGAAVKCYLVIAPVFVIIQIYAGEWVPRWHASGIPINYVKPGDALVTIGIIVAAANLRLLGTFSNIWVVPLVLLIAVHATANRGGALALLTAVCVSWCMNRDSLWPWRIAVALAMALLLAIAVDVRIKSPAAEHREISANQMIVNAVSVIGLGKGGGEISDSTVEWRINWWKKICSYSLAGDKAMFGKGYGVNLAIDDGISPPNEESLRSPHNATMTILARSGMPGTILWLGFLVSWFSMALHTSRRLRLYGAERPRQVQRARERFDRARARCGSRNRRRGRGSSRLTAPW